MSILFLAMHIDKDDNYKQSEAQQIKYKVFVAAPLASKGSVIEDH